MRSVARPTLPFLHAQSSLACSQDQRRRECRAVAEDLAQRIAGLYDNHRKGGVQFVFDMQLQGIDDFSVVVIVGSGQGTTPHHTITWPQPIVHPPDASGIL